MSDPAQPSGSRVTAPPPEPSEAMVEITDEMVERKALQLYNEVEGYVPDRPAPDDCAVQRGSFPPQEMEALFEAVHATDGALAALGAGPGCGVELAEAAERVVRARKRIIDSVTPEHPEWCADDVEQYNALFSDWHRATVDLGKALAAVRASGEAIEDTDIWQAGWNEGHYAGVLAERRASGEAGP